MTAVSLGSHVYFRIYDFTNIQEPQLKKDLLSRGRITAMRTKIQAATEKGDWADVTRQLVCMLRLSLDMTYPKGEKITLANQLSTLIHELQDMSLLKETSRVEWLAKEGKGDIRTDNLLMLSERLGLFVYKNVIFLMEMKDIFQPCGRPYKYIVDGEHPDISKCSSTYLCIDDTFEWGDGDGCFGNLFWFVKPDVQKKMKEQYEVFTIQQQLLAAGFTRLHTPKNGEELYFRFYHENDFTRDTSLEILVVKDEQIVGRLSSVWMIHERDVESLKRVDDEKPQHLLRFKSDRGTTIKEARIFYDQAARVEISSTNFRNTNDIK